MKKIGKIKGLPTIKGLGIGKGWKGESVRHGLASRGIATGRKEKYGKDRKTYYIGKCSHGVKFKDTFIGCETNCPICLKKGKISGFHQAKLRREVKKPKKKNIKFRKGNVIRLKERSRGTKQMYGEPVEGWPQAWAKIPSGMYKVLKGGKKPIIKPVTDSQLYQLEDLQHVEKIH